MLARNGRPVMGDLRYLADTKMSAFDTALARAQIGAALALLGDRGRAQTAFAAAVQKLRERRDGSTYRADYGSRLRDGAGLLTLASEFGAAREVIQPIGQTIEDERATYRVTSTQENAWMVLAAQALLKDAEAIAVKVDGVEEKGALYRTFRDAALADKPVAITNAGNARCSRRQRHRQSDRL